MSDQHPAHVCGFVRDAASGFPNDASECHHYYQIVCQCGGRDFDILVSDRQSVVAVCAACGSHVLVYDLTCYPCAVKREGAESFRPSPSIPVRPTRIFVLYEYGEPEPDMEFDPNDITWCQVFAEVADGSLVKVFDDETC
jgi:hypothetical protein